MLGAIATQMSLLMTGVALNFSQISLSSPALSLHKSSSRYVSSAHCRRIYIFTSHDSSSGSSSRGVHGVWVVCQSLWHPPTRLWRRCCSSSMCSEPCLHVNVILLAVYGGLLPLIICSWSIEFQYLLIQSRW